MRGSLKLSSYIHPQNVSELSCWNHSVQRRRGLKKIMFEHGHFETQDVKKLYTSSKHKPNL